MSDHGEEPDLDGMAGSYRAQTEHLTRTIKVANARQRSSTSLSKPDVPGSAQEGTCRGS
jgi:hypothetical protein